VSFHSDLIAASAWPADLVTAGVVATAGQVVSGRRAPDKIDSRGAVWLERLPVPVSGDAQQVRAHAYRAHYLYRLNAGGDKAGTAQTTHVEAKLRVIANRYHGGNPAITGVSNVISISAIEDSTDEDPEAHDLLTGSVTVTFYVKE
jgi:hypothetical protein